MDFAPQKPGPREALEKKIRDQQDCRGKSEPHEDRRLPIRAEQDLGSMIAPEQHPRCPRDSQESVQSDRESEWRHDLDHAFGGFEVCLSYFCKDFGTQHPHELACAAFHGGGRSGNQLHPNFRGKLFE